MPTDSLYELIGELGVTGLLGYFLWRYMKKSDSAEQNINNRLKDDVKLLGGLREFINEIREYMSNLTAKIDQIQQDLENMKNEKRDDK